MLLRSLAPEAIEILQHFEAHEESSGVLCSKETTDNLRDQLIQNYPEHCFASVTFNPLVFGSVFVCPWVFLVKYPKDQVFNIAAPELPLHGNTLADVLDLQDVPGKLPTASSLERRWAARMPYGYNLYKITKEFDLEGDPPKLQQYLRRPSPALPLLLCTPEEALYRDLLHPTQERFLSLEEIATIRNFEAGFEWCDLQLQYCESGGWTDNWQSSFSASLNRWDGESFETNPKWKTFNLYEFVPALLHFDHYNDCMNPKFLRRNFRP